MESSLLRPVPGVAGGTKTTNLSKMADYKTELYFIGQIVGCSDYLTDIYGLLVEASLKYGPENWHLVPEKASVLQTHTAYCDDEGFFVGLAHSNSS